jgi:hypothetical protein
MRARKLICVTGILALAFPAGAAAQAMAEYGLGVGRAGVSGAAAGRSVGKSTGAVFSQAGRTASQAGQKQYPVASPNDPKRAAPAPRPEPEVADNPVLDLEEVKEGLERKELLEKFGKPSMRITMMDGSDVIERLLYRAPGRDTVVVLVRNGKVASASAIAN